MSDWRLAATCATTTTSTRVPIPVQHSQYEQSTWIRVHGQCRPPQCTFVAKMKSDSSEHQSRTESEWPQIASGHTHTHTQKQTETQTESSKKALQQAGTACRALSTDSVTGFDHQAAAAAAAAVDVVISHCFLCVHTCATSVKVRER